MNPKVYVVSYQFGLYDPNKDYDGCEHDEIWTISKNPHDTGWETDAGYDGYGLDINTALYYAQRINGEDAK